MFADFMCTALNITLCLVLLIIGVCAVEIICKVAKNIIFGKQEEKR